MFRWWCGRSRRRGFSSASKDQERCFLHADSEEVKDAQFQRLATLAHAQVLNQRTLLQPQGVMNSGHIPYEHFVPFVDASAGAEGRTFPVWLCLYLSFVTACCELNLLTCLTAQGYKVTLRFLQFMSVDIETIPAGRISLLFYSSCSKCPKCSNPGMPKIGVTSVHEVPCTFCPLCYGFLMFICLPPDICIYSSLWFSH